MKKALIISTLVFLTLAWGNVIRAETMVEKSIEARLFIPPYQELSVIEPIRIDDPKIWAEANLGEPLIFKNTGQVKVYSNTGWVLNVQNKTAEGLQVFIRPKGEVKWEILNGGSVSFSGSHGKKFLSWDIKIIIPPESDLGEIQGLALKETLFQVTLTTR